MTLELVSKGAEVANDTVMTLLSALGFHEVCEAENFITFDPKTRNG
jgi:hypothetical protein